MHPSFDSTVSMVSSAARRLPYAYNGSLRQPIGFHVSPGEIAEEVSIFLCSGCTPFMLLDSTQSCDSQKECVHVSPGEIAEEVSVCLCCGCIPFMLLNSTQSFDSQYECTSHLVKLQKRFPSACVVVVSFHAIGQ